ncbi:hypothetical protein CKF54_07390 [Psittacicella hinzii]|uniref:Uncharacterized protein n=1 Tax=Psittacicella hinzii TaxID=2028575 RepID=A0A3A1Y127_9GAMM|nr:hypothetical protein [Psittacicella hinzii]RIY31161.1 hypothetical protein CKF54_07390 [Psittacicella hinzii]
MKKSKFLSLGLVALVAPFAGANANANNASFSQQFMPLTLKLNQQADSYLSQVKFFNTDAKVRGYQKPTLAKAPLSYVYNSDARLEGLHKMMAVYYQKVYDYFYANREQTDGRKFLLGLTEALMPFDLSTRGKVYRDAVDLQFNQVIPRKNSGVDEQMRILMKDFAFGVYTSQMIAYCHTIQQKGLAMPTYCYGAYLVGTINRTGFASGAPYFRRLGFLVQIPQEMDKLNNQQKIQAFGQMLNDIVANKANYEKLLGFPLKVQSLTLK